MQWTLADIRARARRLSGRRSTTRLSQAELDEHINNYYQNHLPEEVAPTELQTFFVRETEAGKGEYGLDSDMRAVFPPVFIAGEEAELTHNSAYFFETYPDRYEQKQQQPRTVLLYDRTFWLAPIPDGIYQIKAPVLYRPPALEAEGDSPVDQRWGEAIAVGAAILILRNAGDHEEAQRLDPFLGYHLRLIETKNLLNYHGMRAAPQF